MALYLLAALLAVWTLLPSSGRSAERARISASRMRWTQNVHFSMTPRSRTVTSGFFDSRTVSVVPLL